MVADMVSSSMRSGGVVAVEVEEHWVTQWSGYVPFHCVYCIARDRHSSLLSSEIHSLLCVVFFNHERERHPSLSSINQ